MRRIIVMGTESLLGQKIADFLKRSDRVLEINMSSTLNLIEVLDAQILLFQPAMIICVQDVYHLGQLEIRSFFQYRVRSVFVEINQENPIVDTKNIEAILNDGDLWLSIGPVSGWQEGLQEHEVTESSILADQFACNINKILTLSGVHCINNFEDWAQIWRQQVLDMEKQKQIISAQKHCMFNLVYKYSPLDYVEHRRVAEIRMKMGIKLGETMPKEVVSKLDYVVPVPQTGIYYAQGLAIELRKQYVQALVKTSTESRSFFLQSADARKQLLWSKISPIGELIKGKRLAIVDEAIFTGTTLKVVCDMLRECEVAEIHICIPTPVCENQCAFYVQPERALLLNYMRREMLVDYFGADSVNFLPYEVFERVSDELGTMCKRCFETMEGEEAKWS